MGKRFNDTNSKSNVQIEIEHGGESYLWTGDYDIETSGEQADEDYCGDSEAELTYFFTEKFERFIEATNSWVEAEFSNDMKCLVISEIEKSEGL